MFERLAMIEWFYFLMGQLIVDGANWVTNSPINEINCLINVNYRPHWLTSSIVFIMRAFAHCKRRWITIFTTRVKFPGQRLDNSFSKQKKAIFCVYLQKWTHNFNSRIWPSPLFNLRRLTLNFAKTHSVHCPRPRYQPTQLLDIYAEDWRSHASWKFES